MECEFCGNILKNKYNLKTHQQTSKNCLTKQNSKNHIEKLSNDELHTCDYCYISMTLGNLKRHMQTCKIQEKNNIEKNLRLVIDKKEKELQNRDRIIKDLKKQLKDSQKQITELQNKIENIAIKSVSKSTTTINNQRYSQVINNLIPITEEYLLEQAKYLTIEHVKNGAQGYAQYALEYPLKDRIICSDFGRKKIRYKDHDGNVINDPEMSNLTVKLFKAIEEKNTILIDEYLQELSEKYNVHLMDSNNEMDDNEALHFNNKAEFLIDELFKIKNTKREIDEVIKGTKPEIYHDFIKDVCTKITT